jgi:hypothetical protein
VEFGSPAPYGLMTTQSADVPPGLSHHFEKLIGESFCPILEIRVQFVDLLSSFVDANLRQMR